ncbi:MAG TPA: Fic family protein, partial [Ktedonobacterales bacterium]|nr:Fic family protein [Ktedonobacterales bacterium]
MGVRTYEHHDRRRNRGIGLRCCSGYPPHDGTRQHSSLPISLRLVRKMHEILLSGVRGQQKRPGDFRKEQNWVGGTTTTLANAHYVPPPPAEMTNALHEWEKFVNERDSLPDLIQCALMHAQFESIHPFLDGNGRLGRLLITLFLIERKRLGQPLLYLSAYI